jgi:hypothetical protein
MPCTQCAVPPPCGQLALRSLQEDYAEQVRVAAIATLTQLTRLALNTSKACDTCNLSCLSALAGLQSLSLSHMRLEAPGLSLVAQGCSSLTQLHLAFVSVEATHPGKPSPPQAPCRWPALQELQLHMVQPGFVSTVLPTPQAAPLLVRLTALPAHDPGQDAMPGSWPLDLQWAGFSLSSADEDRRAKARRLAGDLRCLAACCQALHLELEVSCGTPTPLVP